MKTTEYVVELKYYKENALSSALTDSYHYPQSTCVGEETITVFAVSEAQARSTAINHGIRKGNPEGSGVEVVSIKKGQ